LLKVIKYIAIVPMLTACLCCSGQGFRFQFYRTKACSTVEKLDTQYEIHKVGNLDTGYSPKAGVVYLPGPGSYGIWMDGPLLDTVFDIRDTGLFVFRFKEPDHGFYETHAVDTPPLYSRCDTMLEGYQEYNYPDGTLEMRGTFKDGYEKDSLVTFYRNGKVKMRLLRPPKIITITDFDSLGNKLSIKHIEHKSFMVYREYDLKEFYPGGKVKKIESSKKRVSRINEFYSSGLPKIVQTKNRRTEYYDNGLKSVAYTWKHKKSNDITIYKTAYDTTGRLLQKTVCEEWITDYIPQPSIKISRSDLIVSIEKYDGGKVVFSVKDIDTKEYLKKYPDDDDEDGDDIN